MGKSLSYEQAGYHKVGALFQVHIVYLTTSQTVSGSNDSRLLTPLLFSKGATIKGISHSQVCFRPWDGHLEEVVNQHLRQWGRVQTGRRWTTTVMLKF